MQTVKRPEGVRGVALITQEHDLAMVHYIFDSTWPLLYLIYTLSQDACLWPVSSLNGKLVHPRTATVT